METDDFKDLYWWQKWLLLGFMLLLALVYPLIKIFFLPEKKVNHDGIGRSIAKHGKKKSYNRRPDEVPRHQEL